MNGDVMIINKKTFFFVFKFSDSKNVQYTEILLIVTMFFHLSMQGLTHLFLNILILLSLGHLYFIYLVSVEILVPVHLIII